MFKIVNKKVLNPTVTRIDVYAPFVAKKAEAGQFVIIRATENGERIPLTVADYDREKGTVAVIFQIVGATTYALNQLEVGDSVADFVGPLGNATETEGVKNVCVVGGGVGSAPLYYLAEQLKKNGNDFVILIGARAEKDLYRRDAYEALGRVEYTTEDGSLGEKGYVTNHSVLAEKFDRIYTCGPKPMMLAVAKYARENGIACEVSLENKMACGLGACLCCVEDTKEGHKCVCTDGPVFSIDELKW